MMGRGHAASGMAAGAACNAWALPAVGYVVPGGAWSTVLLGTILAGYSLAPDIDTKRATASTAFGPFSRATHRFFAWLSLLVTGLTGTRYDEPREHRGLTHSLVSASALAVLVGVIGQRWPIATISVIFGIAVGMLARLAIKPHLSASAGLAAGVALFFISPVVPGPGALLVAAAVGLGCAVHIWGDWITRQGVPLFGPLIKFRGKRWWNFRPPLALTFRAGSKVENVFVAGFWVITALAVADTAGLL